LYQLSFADMKELKPESSNREWALSCRLFRRDLIRDGLVKADWMEMAFIEQDIERMVH